MWKILKKYSESQSSIWQQVPWWANQADGRSGFSDNNSRAIHSGFWAIKIPYESGSYNVFVDLENGKLVNPYRLGEYASEQYILPFALYPDEINATKLVDYLKKDSELSYGRWYNDKQIEETEAKRQINIEKLGLFPDKYTRLRSKESIVNSYNYYD